MRVEVLTDRPIARFTPGTVLHREGRDEPLTIASAEPVADGPGWRIRFRELADRTAAETLRGAYLEAIVRPEDMLERGEYYWHEVIGATVRGVDGAELGTVREVYRIGETEVFEVAGGRFGSFDLPAVRAFIRVFAPHRREIVVDAEALDRGSGQRREPASERPRAPRRVSPRRKAPPSDPSGTAPVGGDPSVEHGPGER